MNLPLKSAASKVVSTYNSATRGLQNYGRNMRKNIEASQMEFQKKRGSRGFDNYQSRNPLPNPLKRSSYQ